MEINKNSIYQQLMWDYNLPTDKIDDLMSGKIERLGHYNQEMMFKKMIESLSWFVLLEVVGIEKVTQLLSDNVIEKLRSPALKDNYYYVKKRLQEIISDTR
jgi:hypothetical protein